MPAVKFHDLMNSLRNRDFAPIYLLQGEEAYEIDKASAYIAANVLNESEQSFNQTVVYGNEADPATIADMAMRYPMMASHQVLIVKEAQQMRGIAKLQAYVENPQPTTVLVLCYKGKSVDKRTAFYKALNKKAQVLTTSKLYDNQIPNWIERHLSESGFQISPHAASLLTDYIGNDLSKLSNELEKLMLNMEPGSSIDAADIEKNIGISKDYNVFELQNAIGNRDSSKTFRIVQYAVANPKALPLVMVIGTLFGFFQKLHMFHFYPSHTQDRELAGKLGVNPFFVRDYKTAARNFSRDQVEQIIGLLHEYDLRSKGVRSTGADEGELLKEMVVRILN